MSRDNSTVTASLIHCNVCAGRCVGPMFFFTHHHNVSVSGVGYFAKPCKAMPASCLPMAWMATPQPRSPLWRSPWPKVSNTTAVAFLPDQSCRARNSSTAATKMQWSTFEEACACQAYCTYSTMPRTT